MWDHVGALIFSGGVKEQAGLVTRIFPGAVRLGVLDLGFVTVEVVRVGA